MIIHDLNEFVRESNKIEGIRREPLQSELDEHRMFFGMNYISLPSLATFVHHIQPGAQLRNQYGLDVRVGSHIPPRGGPYVYDTLRGLLARINDHAIGPYEAHHAYESLHPFTDGNGRSGRAIWAWMMLRTGSLISLGFLHAWYYQSLQAGR